MPSKDEIYGYAKKFDRLIYRIQHSELCDRDKLHIDNFSRYLFAQGMSQARILKLVNTAFLIALRLKKPFGKATKDDLIDLVQKIEREPGYSSWTKHDYKLALRKFFKFIKETEVDPEETRWIKLGRARSRAILPQQLLTSEEIQDMVKVARLPMDRAFLMVLYESGCRIGELLSLEFQHVSFDKFGARLMVTGKMGTRSVRVFSSNDLTSESSSSRPITSSACLLASSTAVATLTFSGDPHLMQNFASGEFFILSCRKLIRNQNFQSQITEGREQTI